MGQLVVHSIYTYGEAHFLYYYRKFRANSTMNFTQTNQTYFANVDIVFYRLSFLFGEIAVLALDLIDRQCIIHIQAPSGRELYQIQRGTATNFYICLVNSNYCSCPAFSFQGIIEFFSPRLFLCL